MFRMRVLLSFWEQKQKVRRIWSIQIWRDLVYARPQLDQISEVRKLF